MIIKVPPNTTLLRLIINNPDKFYKQDWYFNEEFANKDVGGIYTDTPYNTLPAAVYAYRYLKSKGFEDYYMWTNDFDSKGDRVYVGGAGFKGRPKGFQIHRHLTIDPSLFENRIDNDG
jgi:hypothetical protein